jgi:GAF domain-containing protein
LLTIVTSLLSRDAEITSTSLIVAIPAWVVAGAAIALGGHRTERSQPYLAKLAHSGRLITTAPSPQLAATLTAAAADLGFEVACLLLLDEDSKMFTVCGVLGLPAGLAGRTLHASEGLFGLEPAARLARRVIVADDYPASPFANSEVVAWQIRSALAAPLSVGGKPIGVLVGAKRTIGFTPAEVEAFEVLALQGGLGLETVARRRAALEAATL